MLRGCFQYLSVEVLYKMVEVSSLHLKVLHQSTGAVSEEAALRLLIVLLLLSILSTLIFLRILTKVFFADWQLSGLAARMISNSRGGGKSDVGVDDHLSVMVFEEGGQPCL